MIADEDLNAPIGGQPTMPAETIATESATATEAPTSPAADSEAPEPVAEATEPEADGAAEAESETPQGEAKPEKMDWRERRRIEETNKRKQAEAERDELRKEIERLRGPAPATDDETTTQPKAIEDIRREERENARREIEAEQQSRSFAEATGRVLKAGQTAYQDFDAKRAELVENFGEQLAARPDFFEAIVEMPNGHDVFYALASDPDQAESVLSLTPVKMAMALAKIASDVGKPAAPVSKPISKAPAPIRPVTGAPTTVARLDDPSTPMDTWAQTYLSQMAGKGR